MSLFYELSIPYFVDLQIADPGWYQALTGSLTDEQKKGLQEVFVLADQRKAAAESKRIEQSGGMLIPTVAEIHL